MGAMQWYDYLLLAISLCLILIIVLQNSKEDASKAFSGEKSELFANQKQRGAEKVINQITTVLSIAFFVVAMLVVILPKL